MNDVSTAQSQPHADAYYTIKQAAEAKQLPYWKLLRACNDGLIPTYTLCNTRRYVRLDEIDTVLRQNSAS